MTMQDDLYNALWDYVYGLLEPDEVRALEARITSEHAVARAYAEVRQQADHLQAAARIEVPIVSLELPAETPATCSAPEPSYAVASQQISDTLAVRGMRWLLAAAALVLIALAMGNWWRAAAWRNADLLAQVEQDLATKQVRLIAIASKDFDAKSPRQISVQTTNLLGLPQATAVTWQFMDSDGIALATKHSKTAENGRIDLQVDASQLTTATHMNLWCEQQPEVPPLVVPLNPSPAHYATTIITDKPTYRAGEAVYFRSLTLQELPPNYWRDFYVAYRLESTTGELVDLPQLRGLTEQGVGNGAIRLAEKVPTGRYGITALSSDAEFPAATAWFDVADDSTELWNKQFVFDKRVYAPGEEVRAKVQANTAAGEPVANLDVKLGAIVNGGAIELKQAKTDEFGEYVARFTLPSTQPRGEAELKATLTDGTRVESLSQSFTVQPSALVNGVVASNDYLMSTLDSSAATDGGIALNITAPANSDRRLIVSATCRDIAVGQKLVTLENGSNTVDFELPIAPQAEGLIRVSLYDYETNGVVPLADCWVNRPMNHYWQITAEPARAEPATAENVDATTQTWEVQVADETNQPGRAALGVRVVALDVANQVAPANSELLLAEVAAGTKNLASLDDQLGSGLRNDLALASASPPLQCWDNLSEATAALESATNHWSHERSRQLQHTALMIAGGSLVLMLAIVLMLILNLASRESYWLSLLTAGAATFLVSITWFGAHVDSPSGPIVKRLTDEQRQLADVASVAPAEDHPVQNRPVAFERQLERPGDTADFIDPHWRCTETPLRQLPDHFALPSLESYYANGNNKSLFADMSPILSWGRLREAEALSEYGLHFGFQPSLLHKKDAPAQLALSIGPLGTTEKQLSDFDTDPNFLAYLLPPRLPITTFAATTTTPAPDTLYWQPLLMTDENGRARLQLPKPPTNRSYRLFIDAHGNGRLGSFDRELTP